MTKTQIDRLGDRLRTGEVTDADLQLLDTYRRTFAEAYENVIEQIRDQLGLEPTGRPAKSTTSVGEKLRRESIRLSQIQDIAGCRLIAADIVEQDILVGRLQVLFHHVQVIDRRQNPSHGYRAVHVVVQHVGKLIEVQVRTSLQHLWAEVSEKFSDVVDATIKYGGGDAEVSSLLLKTSSVVATAELAEQRLATSLAKVTTGTVLSDDVRTKIDDVREQLTESKRDIASLLKEVITKLER